MALSGHKTRAIFDRYNIVSSSDGEKYANKKAEFYWGLRMRFQAGDVAGLTDEKTISQLAGILYEHDARGRVAIESKEDARKRGVKSPDRAEAVMLAFATPALGWTLLDYEADVDQSTVGSQIREGLPIYIGVDPMPTCGECAQFRAGPGHLGRCGQHGLLVAHDTRACESYDAP